MPKASGDDGRVILFSPRNRNTRQALQERSRSFDWLDERWASIHLPWIRLAAGVLGKDDSALEAAISKLSAFEGEDGSLATLFKRWREAKRDIDEMRHALDVAMTRSLNALERVGCRPDNSPPSCG
jgi:hypothetical protein